MTLTAPPRRNLSNEVRAGLRRHSIIATRFLGAGSYATVYAAYRNSERCPIAVKIIDTSKKTDYVKKFLPRESELVVQVRHPNIVCVESVFSFGNYTCMISEFCENGDLLERIKKMSRIPESDARPMFRQLIEALKYLDALQIVHRDLKCENILLDRMDNVKLADFGFARFLRHGESSSTFCGSRAYVAPEVLRARKYNDNAIDIWSAGIVLYVMTAGVMPYDDRDMHKMVERQMAHKIRFPRITLSWELKKLIHDILHPHPEQRLTFEEICGSEWLRNTPYVMRTEDDCSTANVLEMREDQSII